MGYNEGLITIAASWLVASLADGDVPENHSMNSRGAVYQTFHSKRY